MSEYRKMARDANDKMLNGKICFDEYQRCISLLGKGEYVVRKHADCETCANSAVCAQKYGF